MSVGGFNSRAEAQPSWRLLWLTGVQMEYQMLQDDVMDADLPLSTYQKHVTSQ